MNIAITPAIDRRPRLVVVPAPRAEAEASGYANVIKLSQHVGDKTPRATPASDQVAGRAGASSKTASVAALDPASAERTVVCAMACKVAQAALEVLSGVRSIQQLSRWLSTNCMNALTTRARLHSAACRAMARRQSAEEGAGNILTLYHKPVVHSVHASAVSPGVYETSVVVADKTRFRAIAIRFERSRGLWKVTALQIG